MNMNMYVCRMTETPDSESAGEPGEPFEAFNDEARYAGFMGRFCNGRGDAVENNRSGRLARAVSPLATARREKKLWIARKKA